MSKLTGYPQLTSVCRIISTTGRCRFVAALRLAARDPCRHCDAALADVKGIDS
jgi:hypothetical protein